MANLSGNLGDVSSSARVIEAPSMSSGLSTAVNALSKTFDVVHDTIQANATRKRQEAAEARATEDQAWQREERSRTRSGWAADDYAGNAYNALDAASRPSTAIVQDTVEANPGFAPELSGLSDVDEAYVNSASRQLTTTQTAVTQGGLPPIALEGLANKLFNQGLAKGIPAGLLAKSFKERGIDAFHGYDAATANQLDIEKAHREERAGALKAGAAALGPQVEGKTDDEVIAVGRKSIMDQQLLDTAGKVAAQQQAANSEARAAKNDSLTDMDRSSTTAGILSFNTATDAFLTDVLRTTNPQAAPERGSDTTYEMKQAKVIATTTQYLAEVKNRTLNKMRVEGYSPSAVSAAEAQIDSRTKDVLSGLQAGGEAFSKSASLISQSFGLRMREAMPLAFQMKAAGIDYSQMPEIINAVNPQVKAQLGKQMSAIFSDGIVDSAEKVHLKSLIAVATGKATLNDVDTAAGKRALVGDAMRYVTNTTGAVAAGRADGKTWLNMKRSVVIGASTVTANDSAAGLRNAASAVAGAGSIDALNRLMADKGTSEEATLTASAARGAAARVLTAATNKMRATLGSIGTNDYYQILHFDDRTGQWSFAFNDRKWNAAQAKMTGPAAGYSTAKPSGPSADAQALLQAMNGTLSFLTRTASWDHDTGAGDSFGDVARYYAKGTPLPSQVKAAQASKGKRSIYDIQDSVIEAGSHIPDISVGSSNADIIGPEGTGKNPRSSAQGVGQFTNGTWLSVMRKHAPELIEGKSEADILAMRSNAELGRKAVGWYRGDNAAHLASRGLPSGRTATAIAHFAGPQGAEALFKADPSAPVETALGAAAVRANPQLRGKTVGEAIEWAKAFYRA